MELIPYDREKVITTYRGIKVIDPGCAMDPSIPAPSDCISQLEKAGYYTLAGHVRREDEQRTMADKLVEVLQLLNIAVLDAGDVRKYQRRIVGAFWEPIKYSLLGLALVSALLLGVNILVGGFAVGWYYWFIPVVSGLLGTVVRGKRGEWRTVGMEVGHQLFPEAAIPPTELLRRMSAILDKMGEQSKDIRFKVCYFVPVGDILEERREQLAKEKKENNERQKQERENNERRRQEREDERERRKRDPFLIVEAGNSSFVIGVWGEKTFAPEIHPG